MKRLEEDLKRIVTSNDINSMVRLHASEAIQCLKVSDRVNNKLFHYGSEGKIELFRVSYGIKGGIPGVMRGYEFLFYATEIASLNKELNFRFEDLNQNQRYKLGFGSWTEESEIYGLIPLWIFRLLDPQTKLICPLTEYVEGPKYAKDCDDDVRFGCVAYEFYRGEEEPEDIDSTEGVSEGHILDLTSGHKNISKQ